MASAFLPYLILIRRSENKFSNIEFPNREY
ncbi:hypothetical protein JL09_g6968 [Pichia kudriavzevii]|uniref:Uncharacterized protein n=1 Tax=Pichia kudriavzevii TaxID=4909 RepID=A0A099NIR3_PICKU|nr:hypothetical protein JL09_g6968 [Pichia kudriavzevii]